MQSRRLRLEKLESRLVLDASLGGAMDAAENLASQELSDGVFHPTIGREPIRFGR
jgi:hypothetical protein